MRITHIYILICFCLSANVGLAQDIHFTQFDRAAIGVNPAHTGNFYGTARLNGNYRDQYRGIGQEFTSINASGEYNIPFAFRDHDWIAVGLQMNTDKAGTADQKMNLYAMSLAYHMAFSKEQNRVLTLGAQYGTGSIKYGGISETRSPNDILGLPSTSSKLKYDNEGVAEGGELNDLMIGALFMNRSKISQFRMGLSVEGILSPDRSAVSRRSDEKPLGFNVTTDYTRGINATSAWSISGWYYSLGEANALTALGKYHFLLNPDSGIRLSAGVGTRSLRSALFYAGVDINDLNIGLSYDHTLTSLSEASGYGALELGVTYIYKHFKKPEPKPLIFCPRL